MCRFGFEPIISVFVQTLYCITIGKKSNKQIISKDIKTVRHIKTITFKMLHSLLQIQQKTHFNDNFVSHR